MEYQRLQLNGFKQALTVTLTVNGENHHCVKTFTEEEAYTLIINDDALGVHCTLVRQRTQ